MVAGWQASPVLGHIYRVTQRYFESEGLFVFFLFLGGDFQDRDTLIGCIVCTPPGIRGWGTLFPCFSPVDRFSARKRARAIDCDGGLHKKLPSRIIALGHLFSCCWYAISPGFKVEKRKQTRRSSHVHFSFRRRYDRGQAFGILTRRRQGRLPSLFNRYRLN